METILIVVHYTVCTFLILVILIQAGKGADIGAVFGGASQTMFGSRGPTTFLNKMTAVVAFVFLATSISLAHLAKTRSMETVLEKAPASSAPVEQAAPAEGTEPAEGEAPTEDAE